MNILALIGSPRKHGNTDILVDEILKGAESKGNKCEKLYLYTHDIDPCIDCRACKKGDLVCVLKDGMGEIYTTLDQADIIIFGTPNYWFGPTATMKLLVDRLRPYVANKRLRGKKALVVTPAGDGPEVCQPMLEMFQMSFKYLQMDFIGSVLATAYDKGEVKKDALAIAKARRIGESL